MAENLKKYQRRYLVLLIIVCIAAILFGGVRYVNSLRQDLTDQAIRNVLTVTVQQQQAFDNFVSGDQERLHSFAEYFSKLSSEDTEDIQQRLKAFGEVDAFYSIINLDTGRFCNNKSSRIFQMDGGELATYRALSGSGARDSYTGLYTDDTMFGYYECFTFADGSRGLIQKSYDERKVSDAFSLSFYNNQGFSCVVNREGDILLRAEAIVDDQSYTNLFELLTKNHGEQVEIDSFRAALDAQETGSMTFTGSASPVIYTYVPMGEVEGWYLISVIPESAITEETDKILLDSKQTFVLLMVILFICAVILLLIWRTHKDIQEKDREIEYQEQLFDIFSTYLSNNTDDVYMMVDSAGGQVEYVSPNVERVLGVAEEDINKALWAFEGKTHSSGEKVNFETMRQMEPGAKMETMKTELVNSKTGEHKWFQENVYCTEVQGKNKTVIYISDRTKERRTQDTLKEALDIAQVANSAKSSFLSSVSHDIRTPMNAIIGFLALLREEANNPDLVLEYTQRIEAASQHLLGLINDVLDMNKIESGSASLNLTEFSVADIIDEINTIIRPQTRAKKQTFDIFVSSFDHEHLSGDKLRINQVLINILSNAVKYTPDGGTIEMRVDELSQVVDNYSRIRFIVKDNGMGMSEEYQKVMFDPFTREESEAVHQIQGTGLGMAITKSLVDLMGGTIMVESTLDRGSTFTVELELQIQETEDDPKFWAHHKVEKMLVADDEEEVCLNVVKAMSETGVTTEYATDGASAVQMMRAAREAGDPYDLVLLDWKMPTLNGLETARLIRKNYSKKIPILLFTAYDWSEIEQEAKEIGVNHFMPKPFFMTTFKDAIRRVMGNLKKSDVEKNSVVKDMHIMVVDDIEVNRIILVKILNTLGAHCEVAANGQEAVNLFENSQPGEYDLILMDVQMPVMDGYAATRAIRASEHPSAKTIPVIAMTANAFVDDVRDAIKSGMDAHIAKPVQLDTLKSTIQQVLDSRIIQQSEG